MSQTRNYVTKKPGKTETQPLWNMSDIKGVVEWFESNNEWDGYLITLLELLLGRRIGDTISMKWCDLYYENGTRKDVINTIEEQKTGKIVNIPISNMVFEAVDKYLVNTQINPLNHYDDFIFSYASKTEWIKRKELFKDLYDNITEFDIDIWCEKLNKDFSKKRKDTIIESFHNQKNYKTFGSYLYYVVEWRDIVGWQSDAYRKKLKKAIETIGITTPVSTHTLRKTFGHWIYKTHIFDPSCLLSLQQLFGHSDAQTTLTYIGLSEEKNRQLINDHGNFIRNVLAGKGDEIIKNMPVVSLKSDDLGEIIMEVIKAIKSNKSDVETYQAAINMANRMRVI